MLFYVNLLSTPIGLLFAQVVVCSRVLGKLASRFNRVWGLFWRAWMGISA